MDNIVCATQWANDRWDYLVARDSWQCKPILSSGCTLRLSYCQTTGQYIIWRAHTALLVSTFQ